MQNELSVNEILVVASEAAGNEYKLIKGKTIMAERRYMFVCLLRTVVRTMMAIPSQIRLAFVKTIWQSRQT